MTALKVSKDFKDLKAFKVLGSFKRVGSNKFIFNFTSSELKSSKFEISFSYYFFTFDTFTFFYYFSFLERALLEKASSLE